MANPRELEVAVYSLTDRGEGDWRRTISVRFADYSTLGRRAKGFYLESRIEKHERGMKTWRMGQKGDGYLLIEEADRFNFKKLQIFYNNVQHSKDLVNQLLDTYTTEALDRVVNIALHGEEASQA